MKALKLRTSMSSKIENVSILNNICFVAYGFSNILNNEKLLYIGFLGVVISFVFSVWICCKSFHFKSEEEKKIFIRSIHSIIFCVLFSILFFFTI